MTNDAILGEYITLIFMGYVPPIAGAIIALMIAILVIDLFTRMFLDEDETP